MSENLNERVTDTLRDTLLTQLGTIAGNFAGSKSPMELMHNLCVIVGFLAFYTDTKDVGKRVESFRQDAMDELAERNFPH